jgi:TP901 family phage tail tape measure protein
MSFARVIGVSAVFSFTANKAISQMTRTEQRFRSLGDSATNARQQINEGFSKLNTLGVIATAAAGTAVKKFADFDKSAMRLQSRLEAGDPALQVFKDRALEVAGATKFTAAEVLQGMEMFKQMGVSGADTLKNMGMMARFAEAENISLEKAIKMGVTSTKAFGMETNDMNRVLNRMMFVAANSAANVNELYNGIRYIGGVTNFTKSNFAELTNILGLFHNNALIGSRSGTVLSNMVNQLSKNAGQGKIQIGKYTAMIHKNAEGGLDITQSILNVATAFRLMQKDALKSGTGMEEVQKVANKLFGMRGSRGVGALLSIVEGKDFHKTVKMYKTGEKEVNKTIDTVYKIRSQNIMDAYIRFTSAVDAFAISMVQNFKGPIFSTLERFSAKITGASKVFSLLLSDFSLAGNAARTIQKMVDPTGAFGISAGSVAIMQGVVQGFGAIASIAQMLGRDLKAAYGIVVEITRSFGGAEKDLARIAAMVVGGGVLITGFTALKFLIGLTVAPVLRIVWGLGAAVVQAGMWLVKQVAIEYSIHRAALGAGGLGTALKAAAITTGIIALKFAAAAAVGYGIYKIVQTIDEVFLNGAMSKFGQKIGDWLSKFESLRGVLASMGLISVGGTARATTAQGAANQTLSTLSSMRDRGMTTVGKVGGGRVALDRAYATERVRKSLQARGYGEAQIAATLKEIAPALERFAPPKPQQNPAQGSSITIVNQTVLDGKKVAESVAKVQNDQLERTGQKVDRRNAMVGIPTPIKGSKR